MSELPHALIKSTAIDYDLPVSIVKEMWIKSNADGEDKDFYELLENYIWSDDESTVVSHNIRNLYRIVDPNQIV